MSELKKLDQAAIEAVARHFSATWEKGENPPDAYIKSARRRVAVEVAAIKQGIADRGALTEPRLRCDKVAVALVERLRDALRESVPDGKAVIFTVTAPIRLPSKTAAALEDKIRNSLARRSAHVALKDAIHGNRVRIWLVAHDARRTSRVIGFVHNPDTNPDLLLDMTRSMLECIGSVVCGRAAARSEDERWLIVTSAAERPHIETYRHICSQLFVPTEFTKTLMVFAGGRVETLAE